MRVSIQWLRDLVAVDDEPRRVGDRLTMAGLAVDALEEIGPDTILELDITSNRGDCLSHLGVARELAAVYGIPVRIPEPALEEADREASTMVGISIADPDLCARYCGRFIEGVEVGPSPDWLVRRLEAVGIRSVNNVADVTNYVLMELGHPLHAFDADTLGGSQIVVRRAELDETLETLDGEKRELDPSMLVIADAGRAVAMAGVMGGADTEITASTRNVLLESAWFDPLTTRRTARALGLSTEASYRFERGTDIEMAPTACDRPAELIRQVAGGRIYRGIIDVYPRPVPRREATLRKRRIVEYLGGEVPDTEVVRILTSLGFEPVAPAGGSSSEGWTFRVPSHRHDVATEEDLMEEIARHYGYARFPSALPEWGGSGSYLPWDPAEKEIRHRLSGMGYSEAASLTFSDPETERAFAPGIEPVALQNPLSEEAPILRTSMVPSMLRALQWNLNRGAKDLALYEIAKIYRASGEERRLVLAATGDVAPQTVHGTHRPFDFFALKGDVEAVLEGFALERGGATDRIPDYYHPGRSLRLDDVAVIGELRSEFAERFKIRQRVYIAEIAVEALYEAGLRPIAAASIPKYPSVRRDLSLLVGRDVRSADVLAAVRDAGVEELVRVEPFDRLEEGPFPGDRYSLAIALEYQSAERTLTDEEVDEYERRVLDRLAAIGVTIRT